MSRPLLLGAGDFGRPLGSCDPASISRLGRVGDGHVAPPVRLATPVTCLAECQTRADRGRCITRGGGAREFPTTVTHVPTACSPAETRDQRRRAAVVRVDCGR